MTSLKLWDEEWVKYAACNGTDPEIFFSDTNGNSALAKSICGTCPVSEECLEFALKYHTKNNDYAHGIWGGLSVRERRALLKERRVARFFHG
jgi:WhiB family redox-sensing transcriptional regulator